MRELQKYLEQVRKLKIVDAQPEVLTFMGAVNISGQIVFESPSTRVQPGYAFFIEQIKGGCPIPPNVYPDDVGQPQNPVPAHVRAYVIGEFLPYISFNVLNEGVSKSMFKTPLPMNLFVNALGTTEGLKFETPIAFFEGADITIQWFVDLVSMFQRYPAGPGAPTGPGQRWFNPGNYPAALNSVPRVEFYAHLIGSLVRAETVL